MLFMSHRRRNVFGFVYFYYDDYVYTHIRGRVCYLNYSFVFYDVFFSGKEKFFFLFVGFSFVFLFAKTTKLFYIFISFFFVVVERRKQKIGYIILYVELLMLKKAERRKVRGI